MKAYALSTHAFHFVNVIFDNLLRIVIIYFFIDLNFGVVLCL